MWSYSSQVKLIQAVQESFLAIAHPFWMFLEYFDTPLYYVLVASLSLVLFSRRQSQAYLFLLTFTIYFNHYLKALFDQPRPAAYVGEVDLIQIGSHFGFPSGGAMGATIIAGVILRSAKGWPAWVFATAYLLLISMSRVYLGAHFFTDILGGWFFGLMTWAFFLGIERWEGGKALFASLSLGKRLLLFALLAGFFYGLHPVAFTLRPLLFATGLSLGYLIYPTEQQEGRKKGQPYVLGLFCLGGTGLIGLLMRSQAFVGVEEGSFLLLGLWLSFLAPWLSFRLAPRALA